MFSVKVYKQAGTVSVLFLFFRGLGRHARVPQQPAPFRLRLNSTKPPPTARVQDRSVLCPVQQKVCPFEPEKIPCFLSVKSKGVTCRSLNKEVNEKNGYSDVE